MLSSISQSFRHKQNLNYLNFYTGVVYTNNLDAIPASYDIKYIKELLLVRSEKIIQLQSFRVFSADFLDPMYLHNVIPPESPFAAIRVSIPTLNLLKIVVPTATNYKIYCDNCPTLARDKHHSLVL